MKAQDDTFEVFNPLNRGIELRTAPGSPVSASSSTPATVDASSLLSLAKEADDVAPLVVPGAGPGLGRHGVSSATPARFTSRESLGESRRAVRFSPAAGGRPGSSGRREGEDREPAIAHEGHAGSSLPRSSAGGGDDLRWCQKGNVMIVGCLVLLQIYLVLIFIFHATPILDEMMGTNDDIRTWIGITPAIRVSIGILSSLLLGFVTYVLVLVTCRWRSTVARARSSIARSAMSRRARRRSAMSSRTSSFSERSFWSVAVWICSCRCFRDLWVFRNAWMGLTGPYLIWWEYFKEVVETILQSLAIVSFSTSGIDSIVLCCYTLILFLNVVISCSLSLMPAKTRKQLAIRTRRIILVDAVCDVLYGTFPFFYVFIYQQALDGTTGTEANCWKDDPSTQSCKDFVAFQLLNLGREVVSFGGQTYSEIILKFLTRLMPILFGSWRFLTAFKAGHIFDGRTVWPGWQGDSRSSATPPNESRGGGTEDGKETGGQRDTTKSGGEAVAHLTAAAGTSHRRAPSDVISTASTGSSRARTTSNPPSSIGSFLGSVTSVVVSRPASIRKKLGNVRPDAVRKRFYREIPRVMTGLLVIYVVIFSVFCWVRLAELMPACKTPALQGVRRGSGGICSVRTYPIFDLGVNSGDCPCTSIAGHQRSACNDERTMAEAVTHLWKKPVLVKYVSIVYLYECVPNVTYYQTILDTVDPTAITVLAMLAAGVQEVGTSTFDQQPLRLARLVELTALSAFHARQLPFDKLPEDIGRLTGLVQLASQGASITRLPESVGELSQLVHVELSRNLITELPSSFGKLTLLDDLSLTHNRLTHLPESAMTSFVQLTHLSLDHVGCVDNTFEFLRGVLPHLHRLRSLFIDNLGLEEFPDRDRAGKEYLGKLSSLQELRASYNGLRMLPANFFDHFPDLKLFHVRGNRLSTLPPMLEESKKKLKRIDLADNLLTSFEDLFAADCNFRSLQQLFLGGNRQAEARLPAGFFSCLGQNPKLEKLDLDQLGLTALPPGLGRLSQLEMLSLGFNALTELPAELGPSMEQLDTLDMEHNLLTSLLATEQFFTLPKIRNAILRGNRISSLSEALFARLGRTEKLVRLDLADNLLTNEGLGSYWLSAAPHVLLSSLADWENGNNDDVLIIFHGNVACDAFASLSAQGLPASGMVLEGRSSTAVVSSTRRFIGSCSPSQCYADPTSHNECINIPWPSLFPDLFDDALNTWKKAASNWSQVCSSLHSCIGCEMGLAPNCPKMRAQVKHMATCSFNANRSQWFMG